jgi:hypothetical protein
MGHICFADCPKPRWHAALRAVTSIALLRWDTFTRTNGTHLLFSTDPDGAGRTPGIGIRVFTAGYGVFWLLGSAGIGALYDRSLVLALGLCMVTQLLAVPLFVWVGRQARGRMTRAEDLGMRTTEGLSNHVPAPIRSARYPAVTASVASVTGMPTRAWLRHPICTPRRAAASTTMMLAMRPPASVLTSAKLRPARECSALGVERRRQVQAQRIGC